MTLAVCFLAAVAVGAAARLMVDGYRNHPDRVAHLADMEGRYPIRGRRRGHR